MADGKLEVVVKREPLVECLEEKNCSEMMEKLHHGIPCCGKDYLTYKIYEQIIKA